MGKKQKEETPNINATPNRDIIQRLNFLYQASVYLQSISPSSSGSKAKHTQDLKKHISRRKRTTGDLARSYAQCMRVVGQKTTVKIDPSLKRSLCSSCNTTLIPGSFASVRVRKSSSHGHLVIYTCLHCKTSKSIPSPSTLPLNLAVGTEESQGSLSAVPGSPESIDKPSLLTMAPSSQSRVPKRERKRKEPILLSPRRLLPLFARPDAGHVVFRGNEVLDQQAGLGICFIWKASLGVVRTRENGNQVVGFGIRRIGRCLVSFV